VVLLVVLFFALLLSASVVTFLRRSTVDSMIARNRDSAAQADALARGGVRLAEALLLEDRLAENAESVPSSDGHLDPWYSPYGLQINVAENADLTLHIEDTGARLNLNALFEVDEAGEFVPRDPTEPFLHQFLEKVVDEMPLPPGERALYDPRELAANLMDYVDSDEVRRYGGLEDDYYQRQEPPYQAANGPLLSPEELRLIEGFDGPLVDALRAYVSVYPYAPGGCQRAQVGCGVNLNSAPPHVLAALFYDDGVDQRLATEDVVRKILRIREEGGSLCPGGESAEGCTPISQVVANAIFPPPTFVSQIFVVTAEARVGEVRRSLEAVVDRSQPAKLRLLSWRIH
jgi:general secretion pathway protein K